MKLFEQSFFAAFKYWVREYNPNTQQSELRMLMGGESYWEGYQPHEAGSFHSIYKPNRRFNRVTGKDSRHIRSLTSPVSPVDRVIRDNYYHKNYNKNPTVFYLDIETRVGTVVPGFPDPSKSLEPVSLIQILDSSSDIIHIIGDQQFYYRDWFLENYDDHKDHEIVYHSCNNELEMFEKFFELIQERKPLVVYAWNGSGFDFPYLYNRCQRLGISADGLCPWVKEIPCKSGELVKLKETWLDGEQSTGRARYVGDLEVVGCHWIDQTKLYRKIVLAPRPSYSLQSIATIELKARKIGHDEFRTFDDFYLGNYSLPKNPTEDQKKTLCYHLATNNQPIDQIRKAGHSQFIYYGIIDVVLSKGIDKKAGLTTLMVLMAERMSSQLNAVLGTTRIWSNAIRNYTFFKNSIFEVGYYQGPEKKIDGGYVKDPVSGKMRWVISADVNSMYPMLAICGSNISPETFVPYDQAPPELRDFAIKYLKAGSPEEQNENNLLNLLDSEEGLGILKQLKEHLVRYNMSMAPNGTFYKKDTKGILPTMVHEIYRDRKAAKDQRLKIEQLLETMY